MVCGCPAKCTATTLTCTSSGGTLRRAYFGMQCFWSAESSFAKMQGVRKTRVGYAGGTTLHPQYTDMGDHTEIIELQYDERFCTYADLLDWFFNHHDSTIKRKRQYESAILYVDEKQKALAEQAIAREQQRHDASKTVCTRLHALDVFHQGEDYHQKYWLRCQRKIYRELRLDDAVLVDSVLATKLNAYLTGYDDGFKELKALSTQYLLADDLVTTVQNIARAGGDPRSCH